MKKKTITTVSLFSLAMLITGSIDSIRNLPAAALFGDKLIFFFILAAIVFLIPVGLISAWLSSSNLSGGVYGWVKSAFGEKVGFFAIWLQWINTMVWYPTILSFIAGLIAYIINPHLAENKYYLILVILSVYWLMTWINLKGLHVSTKFASVCTVIGMMIPMGFIVLLAAIWILKGNPLQIHLNVHTMIPTLHQSESWISLTAIMAAFLGMELATVHVKNIKNPQVIFPKALIFAVTFILITMILGSLSIAFVLPHNQINLVDGVMQAFANFFHVYHLSWLIPVMAVMILLGSMGGMINWMISPAKGLLLAAQDGFLPKFFQKENKNGVANVLLMIQAVIVSLVCLVFLFMPSVNGSYWLLTDLSTELYMMMYFLMFIAAIFLLTHDAVKGASFNVPFKKIGVWILSLLGMLGAIITFIIGFFPPAGINVGGFWHYEIIFALGIIVMGLPVIGFYCYKKRLTKKGFILF